MKRRKGKRIKLGDSRVLLSDILPYELPIIFSNRYFLDVIEKYKLKYSDNKLTNEKELPLILNRFLGPWHCDFTIPFQYKIRHNDLHSRELSIIHPISQLKMIDFYKRYKEIIIYFCNKSHFSIRKPTSIAKRYFYKDNLHKKIVSKEDICIEQYNQEYERLKSFFVYKKYDNIYKFYDDYLFNRCEKKYNFLLKLDISMCFNSIYTHSFSWATHGKEFCKEHLDLKDNSFPNTFDKLMQNLNYKETNGIVIGPEFSRIFAEIILQHIDLSLEYALQKENLFHKKDYEIYRYVDDYFIFYNEDKDKEKIKYHLSNILSQYKLSLNDKKMLVYNKPIITNISKAKKRIQTLLKDDINWEIEDKDNKIIRYFKANALNLISQFKTILSETSVEYKDVLNYTLALIDKKIEKLFIKLSSINLQDKDNIEEKIYKFIEHALEFTSFIYSVYPRVNTTIRFSSILKKIIYFYKRKKTNKNYKHAIFDQIYNDIILILKKNTVEKYTQIETSYLLILLKELGKSYYVSEDFLLKCFSLKKEKNKISCDYTLNYLSIVLILFYIQDKKIYNDIRNFTIGAIREKLNNTNFNFKSCEDLLILLDSISCPYIDENIKKEILVNLEYKENDINRILKYKNNWFISWGKSFNFKKALDAKRGNEVY